MAKPKTPSKVPPATRKADVVVVRGELQQLATIRAHFPQVDAVTAAALLAHHDDESCRAKGANTRAVDTFRVAMSWARTFGEHAKDPALDPVRVRWFLDCLTALGTALTGNIPSANPADEAAFEDAAQAADKLLRRAERRARDAAGTRKGASDSLDAALTPDGLSDARVSRLRQLAALLDAWLAKPADAAPPLRAYGLGAPTVKSLRDAADTLDGLIARRAAPQQIDRDSPAVNHAEGRLYYVMRPLWDDLAEAREDGTTSLQLTVSPALLRGLNIKTDRKKK